MVKQKLIEVSTADARKKSTLDCRRALYSVYPKCCSDRRRPDRRQVRVRQRRLARMASGADRTTVGPRPVASHRSRVSGMSEIHKRRDGDEM